MICSKWLIIWTHYLIQGLVSDPDEIFGEFEIVSDPGRLRQIFEDLVFSVVKQGIGYESVALLREWVVLSNVVAEML